MLNNFTKPKHCLSSYSKFLKPVRPALKKMLRVYLMVKR